MEKQKWLFLTLLLTRASAELQKSSTENQSDCAQESTESNQPEKRGLNNALFGYGSGTNSHSSPGSRDFSGYAAFGHGRDVNDGNDSGGRSSATAKNENHGNGFGRFPSDRDSRDRNVNAQTAGHGESDDHHVPSINNGQYWTPGFFDNNDDVVSGREGYHNHGDGGFVGSQPAVYNQGGGGGNADSYRTAGPTGNGVGHDGYGDGGGFGTDGYGDAGEHYGGGGYGGGHGGGGYGYVKTVYVTKEVPVPYPIRVEKKVPYPVRVPYEKPVPYPVHKPYPVHIEKPVPYPVRVHVPQPYPVTVEKHVPFPVRVHVEKPVAVHVPKPYPVYIEKKVPITVSHPVPYPVKIPVDRPVPVHVPVEKPVPYPVERKVPYPVRVPVDRPYPVHVPRPYPVHVDRPVPYPVKVAIKVPVKVPYPVEVKVPVHIPVHGYGGGGGGSKHQQLYTQHDSYRHGDGSENSGDPKGYGTSFVHNYDNGFTSFGGQDQGSTVPDASYGGNEDYGSRV